MDDWNLDIKNHSISDSNCNIAILFCPIILLQGMTNIVRFTISIEQDK